MEAITWNQFKQLTDLNWFLLPFRPDKKDEDWGECAVLARNPVNILGAFHAQERTLQSYLPLPSPFDNLQTFTHSNDTKNKQPKKVRHQNHMINRKKFSQIHLQLILIQDLQKYKHRKKTKVSLNYYRKMNSTKWTRYCKLGSLRYKNYLIQRHIWWASKQGAKHNQTAELINRAYSTTNTRLGKQFKDKIRQNLQKLKWRHLTRKKQTPFLELSNLIDLNWKHLRRCKHEN